MKYIFYFIGEEAELNLPSLLETIQSIFYNNCINVLLREYTEIYFLKRKLGSERSNCLLRAP